MSVNLEPVHLAITNIDWDDDGQPETIEFHFDKDTLLKNIQENQNVNTTVVEGSQPTQNAVLAFSGQKRDVNLEFRFYNDGKQKDKSNGTMAEAGLADARIAPGPIRDVDTGNDTVTVPGDQRERAPVGETVAVDTKGQATENDGVYSVTSVSYDEGNDETTIGVDGDLTDSTAIGAISNGVVTVAEQIIYWQKYIDNSNIRVQGRLYGLWWDDPDGDGFVEGTPIRLKRFQDRKRSEDPMRGFGLMSADFGFSV